ncbi:MAG: flagellin B, partial [Campylobacteraceae bacterium]|nr:flagellin B [Campylobacteraceae bacterium]
GTALGIATVTYTPESGTGNNLVMESVEIGTTAGTGIGALAAVINKNSETTGVTASWSLTQTGDQPIASGTITNLSINGTIVAASLDVKANDSNGVLVDAINQFTATTGVAASVDAKGQLNLSSTDGRAMTINVATDADSVMSGIVDTPATAQTYTGRLTLTKAGAADIQMAIAGAGGLGLVTTAHEASVSLRDMMSEIDADTAEAMGAFANDNAVGAGQDLTAGVTTYAGAQAMIKIAQTAQEKLDTIRADIGSVQNQLTSTINNISVTQVNVSSAESQIRDVDFAEESASFSKYNIMAQAGSYALSQANSTQQNVLKLLQ